MAEEAERLEELNRANLMGAGLDEDDGNGCRNENGHVDDGSSTGSESDRGGSHRATDPNDFPLALGGETVPDARNTPNWIVPKKDSLSMESAALAAMEHPNEVEALAAMEHVRALTEDLYEEMLRHHDLEVTDLMKVQPTNSHLARSSLCFSKAPLPMA